MGRCRQPLTHHPEGLDLRANRRARRGGYDIVARVPGWSAQLGLSLLLAPRRDADAAGDDECRLLRRSQSVARLAVAGGRRCSVTAPGVVRTRRRAPAARDRVAVVARV